MFSKFKTILLNNDLIGNFYNEISISLISLILAFISYTLIFLFIKQTKWSNNSKRRAITSFRNLIFIIFIITNFFIWSTEIKTAIVSAAAIVGATFIVFKEMILSFVGTIISNRTFKIGDYIEINSQIGKIIDKNFLNTTVLISDVYQSKELIFPNISYINDKIINLSIYEKYRHQKIFFVLNDLSNILKITNEIEQFTNNELLKFKTEILDFLETQEKQDHFFTAPNLNCQIELHLDDDRKNGFCIHYICSDKQHSEIKDKIQKFYLSLLIKNN